MGSACLAPYISLHVNEIGAYLRQALAFLRPQDVSACTSVPGAADEKFPRRTCAECHYLVCGLPGRPRPYFTVSSPDLRRISGCLVGLLVNRFVANI